MSNKLKFNPDYSLVTDFVALSEPSSTFNSAHIIVTEPKGKYIVTREVDKDWVNLVGGRYKKGESAQETVRRECYEETGLYPKNIKFLGNMILQDLTFPIFYGQLDESAYKPQDKKIAEIYNITGEELYNLLLELNPQITKKVFVTIIP